MPPWNAITVARACRAGLAGLALVILSASLAGAFFGPRTTIGKNYQQWSDTESGNGVNPSDCNAISCYLVFQPIPQQQPLIVQHVACRVATEIDRVVEEVFLGTRKGQDPLVDRRTPLVPVLTPGGWWAVSSQVMHLIKSGERPHVRFRIDFGGGDWTVACSISGKLQ